MVLMALDHASMFIARVHSAEFWDTPLPVYPDPYWFFARWLTHMCAPGFFLLMGMGMALFADSRRQAGWSDGRVTSSFVLRGLLLILMQVTVENAAWMIGDSFAAAGFPIMRGGVPGGGSEGSLYLGVLFALGGTMIFWAFLVRVQSLLILALSLAALAATSLVMPGPGCAATLYSPLMRILFIPGHTNVLIVFYPLVPWLGVTGLGMCFARLAKAGGGRAAGVATVAGIGLLLLFPAIRAAGPIGNFNDVPSGWIGFLNVVKYPPSLSFLAVTLGINFMLIAIWPRVEATLGNRRHPLVVFGGSPLFFYLVHLWLYAALGYFFPRESSLVITIAMWLLGLAVLYPLCYWYNGFKHGTPVSSVWRLF